jgi:hypothetical protein
MPTCSTHHRRLPPPIRSREDALAALDLATDGGRERVVALACLDRDRRPLTMFIVEQCAATAAHVILALDALLDAISGVSTPLNAVIVAASRPDPPGGGVTLDDLDAWPLMREHCTRAGVELLEFFVLSDGVVDAVGDVLGSPPW